MKVTLQTNSSDCKSTGIQTWRQKLPDFATTPHPPDPFQVTTATHKREYLASNENNSIKSRLLLLRGCRGRSLVPTKMYVYSIFSHSTFLFFVASVIALRATAAFLPLDGTSILCDCRTKEHLHLSTLASHRVVFGAASSDRYAHLTLEQIKQAGVECTLDSDIAKTKLIIYRGFISCAATHTHTHKKNSHAVHVTGTI